MIYAFFAVEIANSVVIVGVSPKRQSCCNWEGKKKVTSGLLITKGAKPCFMLDWLNYLAK